MPLPYEQTSGPSWDLEMFSKQRGKYAKLPDPGNLPYGLQAMPIPDFQQRHTSLQERTQLIGYHHTNPLIFGRFLGTSTEQTNQPEFLSVNERANWA